GTITMYGWDFGDNNYATEIQATTTHSFATSSQFLITLFVTDNLGATSSLATATINIIPPSQPILEISTTTVLINEIAWMGNASPTDEWIEIYNNTNKDVDLAGWKLVAADGTPEINFNGSTTIISAGGFYLLERINDSTVPEIFADLIYTGALGNGGEKLELKDASGTLIDSVDCSYGWFAGDNKTKETMERINPALPGSDSGNWASSTTSGGTPRAKNSVSLP
ncbi:MAG: lamin tail domain-containing protein, partial [Parcubacteria group bacterium]